MFVNFAPFVLIATFLSFILNLTAVKVVAVVDKTCVCGHTERQTDRHTDVYTQVILYLSNAMNCIGPIKT